MVALSSWIEPARPAVAERRRREESAAADPFSRPGETPPEAKNRIRRFFSDSPDRVGEVGSQVVDRVGFLLLVELRPRRAPSLARSSQEAEKLTAVITTEIRPIDDALVPEGVKSRHVVTIDLASGEVVEKDFKLGKTFGFIPAWGKGKVSVNRSADGNLVTLRVSGAARQILNPLLGNIDYDVFFGVNVADRTINVLGYHDGFPSYNVQIGTFDYDFHQIDIDQLEGYSDDVVFKGKGRF